MIRRFADSFASSLFEWQRNIAVTVILDRACTFSCGERRRLGWLELDNLTDLANGSPAFVAARFSLRLAPRSAAILCRRVINVSRW